MALGKAIESDRAFSKGTRPSGLTMTANFPLILGCLAAGLLACRLSVFAIALIAPILGLLAYFVSDSVWTGVIAFGAMQLGYGAAVTWTALFRRAPEGRPVEPVTKGSPQQSGRAKSPIEGLSP